MENKNWITIIDAKLVEHLINLADIREFVWTGGKYITPKSMHGTSHEEIEFSSMHSAEEIFTELKNMLSEKTFQ